MSHCVLPAIVKQNRKERVLNNRDDLLKQIQAGAKLKLTPKPGEGSAKKGTEPLTAGSLGDVLSQVLEKRRKAIAPNAATEHEPLPEEEQWED